MLPILTSYTTILNKSAIGSITWTWVYVFAQFIMTWALCMIYVRRSIKFDELAAEIVEENMRKGAENKMSPIALMLFVIIVAITLIITYWAAKRTNITSEFYTAGGCLTG